MSEIEKMYENADIKPDCTYLFLVDGNGENEAARTISIGSKADLKRLIVNCGVKGRVIKSTNTLKPFYPPFTTEKQIELIKLFAKNDNIYITFHPSDNAYNIRYCTRGFYDGSIIGDKEVTNVDFKEALAGIINAIWQTLTPEEKQQVKGILE